MREHAPEFRVELGDEATGRLCTYFDLLNAWNPRLHLVAPCPPAEFATRHVLESLLALPFLAEGARVADVGSGGGLPIIPLLAARTDLSAALVEASPKKCVFLREALRAVGAHDRAEVVAERFERIGAPRAGAVTCRALERFNETLPRLLGWAPPSSTLLLFGGPALLERLSVAGRDFDQIRAPRSDRRFLFVVEPAKDATSREP